MSVSLVQRLRALAEHHDWCSFYGREWDVDGKPQCDCGHEQIAEAADRIEVLEAALRGIAEQADYGLSNADASLPHGMAEILRLASACLPDTQEAKPNA